MTRANAFPAALYRKFKIFRSGRSSSASKIFYSRSSKHKPIQRLLPYDFSYWHFTCTANGKWKRVVKKISVVAPARAELVYVCGIWDKIMQFLNDFPSEVEEIEHLWISMSDGTRLAARLWLPAGAERDPVAAILEYIPYRKRDLTAVRDSMNHRYLAGHGFACVRVDIRGSGESEGVLIDEYLEREQQDAEEVLAWIAKQPWCNGRIGMMGLSWGGFAALQLAARQPPELYAVVCVSFTDDRYADDMHFHEGCLLSDNLAESGTMFAHSTCPPDPALVGERWWDMWQERLQNVDLWLENWLRHQRRAQYWKHASVCENYSAVRCPVMAVSGWADGYSNAVFRVIEHLDVPRRGLVGPWSHRYPHMGTPGPAIGFLQEVVRWFSRWLRDEKNDEGDDEPVLRVWMQESVPPLTAYEKRPGRWVGENAWPSPNICEERLQLVPHHLIPQAGGEMPEVELSVESPLSVGQFAGKWCSYSAPPDLPYDQREEDGGSLVFDTDVLNERREIMGAPLVDLEIAADKPIAMIAARISDIHRDGRATRVTYGMLNLTHRNGHEQPEPLVPGERYRVRIRLNQMAQAFPPGHRIRLSLSTSYWPLAWPPPEPVRLSVFTGASSLILPVRPVNSAEDISSLRPFDEPEAAEPLRTTQVEEGRQKWTVLRDLIDYESALDVRKSLGKVRLEDTGTTVMRDTHEYYRWIKDDFESAAGEVTTTMGFYRDDWNVETVTRTLLECTRTEFIVHAELDAYKDSRRVISRNWDVRIPRDMV